MEDVNIRLFASIQILNSIPNNRWLGKTGNMCFKHMLKFAFGRIIVRSACQLKITTLKIMKYQFEVISCNETISLKYTLLLWYKRNNYWMRKYLLAEKNHQHTINTRIHWFELLILKQICVRKITIVTPLVSKQNGLINVIWNSYSTYLIWQILASCEYF